MTYLTNTKLENKSRCEYAAKKSGMKVEFRDRPMPKEMAHSDEPLYSPESLRGVYGSVFTHEDGIDHSKFWDAWDEYQA